MPSRKSLAVVEPPKPAPYERTYRRIECDLEKFRGYWAEFPYSGRQAIYGAIADLQSVSNVRVREVQPRRTSNGDWHYPGSWMRIGNRDSGCYAQYRPAGSASEVNLGSGCLTRDIVTHEIGHVLGLQHEQKRNDRDNYVRVLYENIKQGYADQFTRIGSAGTSIGNYDLWSLMHYGPYFFSRNGKPTIIPNIGLNNWVTDRATRLSSGDISALQALYPAAAVPKVPPKTEDTHPPLPKPPKPAPKPGGILLRGVEALVKLALRGINLPLPGILAQLGPAILGKFTSAAISKLTGSGGDVPSGLPLNNLTGKNLYDPGSDTFYGRKHVGWDLRSTAGDTRVFAPRPGQWNPYGIGGNLDSSGGIRDTLHHLMDVARAGMVKVGDVLGRYAQVGLSNIPHLHWERYINGQLQSSPNAYGLSGSAVYRERGGPVSRGMAYIVGEKRPEVFVPQQNGHIVPRVPNGLSVPLTGGGEMSMVVIHAMVQREHEQYIQQIANPPVPTHQVVRALDRARAGVR